MNSNHDIPTHTDLVLVGGGHSHLFVLRHFAMNPIAGVRLTLVTRDLHTPYSGMLPGFVAGHYTYEEAHIDLQRLARQCGARLIHAEVKSIDADARSIQMVDRPALSYDIVSLNIGSRPTTPAFDVAHNQFAIKPVDGFIANWSRLEAHLQQADAELQLMIAGAGAGGVELALSLEYRARHLAGRLKLSLCTDATGILSGHNPRVQAVLGALLEQRAIQVYTQTEITAFDGQAALTRDGAIPADVVIWVTHASPAGWLADSGIALDRHGFIEVDSCLRSTSHAQVFAAGDIASVTDHPRPKSGVFAVRQGLPLAKNIARQIRQLPLKPFNPQRQFLSLISTGERHAVASRGNRVFQGKWCWWLKDWIDRRFVRQFSQFSRMSDSAESSDAPPMHCAGCGAKVGSQVLETVLERVFADQGLSPMSGFDHADDASLIAVPPGKQLVQSVDHFRAFVDDAFLFGRITANHALGDLHAMGLDADSALVVATVPYADEDNQARDLYQLMSGVVRCLSEHEVRLIGGHSGEASELACGLTVNGFAQADQLLLKSGLRPGDWLLITKPLGTGTLLAAEMRGLSKGSWIQNALHGMTVSSQAAARCLRGCSATACTDVTGFGLAGHLYEMLRASGCSAEIALESLPLLPGAIDASNRGITSSLAPQNRRFEQTIGSRPDLASHPAYPLLFDPQTAGGLLAGIDPERAEACLRELHQLGYSEARIIGRVVENSSEANRIELLSA